MVKVNEPAAEALANEILFPPTSATLIPVPVIDVPPPLKDCVPSGCTDAEIVIVEFACPIPIPAPAEIDTELDVALRLKFVAVGTVGPEMVIVEALLWSVILFPATSDTLPVEALSVNAAPAPPAPPIIVIVELSWESVMFVPATKETLFVEPFRLKFCALPATAPAFLTNMVSTSGSTIVIGMVKHSPLCHIERIGDEAEVRTAESITDHYD